MPSTAGFAAALTVRESVLRAAVQAAYANGSDSGKKFDQDLSEDGIGMVTDLFLGQFGFECEGATNLLVVTLPMWGTVTTTVNAVTYDIKMNGVIELTLTPQFRKGLAVTHNEKAILLDQVTTVINARSWSATVTSTAVPPNVAALITGDVFRSRFEGRFRQGVFFGQIALPSIDGSFLGSLVPESSEILGRVRNGVLLIGLSFTDATHALAGNVEALQDFAGSNDVAGLVHPEAVDIMVNEVHRKLIEGVEDAGATLNGFRVQPRAGFFRVTGTVSKTGGSVYFSFRIVPSMFHTRPGAYFPYLEKPVRAKSRTWAALEFSITDVETDVDRAWWEILFGEVIGGILTLGMLTIYLEGVLSAAAYAFAAKIKAAKLGGPASRIQTTVPPPGGIGTRVALDRFEITDSGVFIGVSVRSKPSPAKLLGPKTVPETYRSDILRYIMTPPSGVAKSDPALRIRWTLEDRTNNVVLQESDGAAAGRMWFEFSPGNAAANDFTIVARLYRRLGVAVTDLATESVNLHMRPALAPQAYTRWRWQGSNPQVGVSPTTGDWFYNGEKRVDRWSEWHRTDAPCRSVNVPNRFRYDEEKADRLPFSLKLLENHRKGLCPYCFYGGPAGVNANL